MFSEGCVFTGLRDISDLFRKGKSKKGRRKPKGKGKKKVRLSFSASCGTPHKDKFSRQFHYKNEK